MNEPIFYGYRAERSSLYTSLFKTVMSMGVDLDVGRNKTARRQPGWAFPAIGAPETPVLRLTRGQAYSGLRRDVYNGERSGVGTMNSGFGKLLPVKSLTINCLALIW